MVFLPGKKNNIRESKTVVALKKIAEREKEQCDAITAHLDVIEDLRYLGIKSDHYNFSNQD